MKVVDKTENKAEQYYIKNNLIFEYLNNTFKVKRIIKEELDNNTIYQLIFNDHIVGIMLSNELIIYTPIDKLYLHSYDLVLDKIVQIIKGRYIKNGSDKE